MHEAHCRQHYSDGHGTVSRLRSGFKLRLNGADVASLSAAPFVSLVKLAAPPGLTKVPASHGTVGIIVTAMAVAPFIVWMKFALMFVAVVAGISRMRNGTVAVAPQNLIVTAPPVMGKTNRG